MIKVNPYIADRNSLISKAVFTQIIMILVIITYFAGITFICFRDVHNIFLAVSTVNIWTFSFSLLRHSVSFIAQIVIICSITWDSYFASQIIFSHCFFLLFKIISTCINFNDWECQLLVIFISTCHNFDKITNNRTVKVVHFWAFNIRWKSANFGVSNINRCVISFVLTIISAGNCNLSYSDTFFHKIWLPVTIFGATLKSKKWGFVSINCISWMVITIQFYIAWLTIVGLTRLATVAWRWRRDLIVFTTLIATYPTTIIWTYN